MATYVISIGSRRETYPEIVFAIMHEDYKAQKLHKIRYVQYTRIYMDLDLITKCE